MRKKKILMVCESFGGGVFTYVSQLCNTTLLCFIIYAVFHFTFMRRICRKELEGVQPYNMRIYLMITLTFMTLGFLFLFSYQYKVLRYVLIIIIFGVTLLKKKRIMEMLKRFISIKKS